ncbi:MAG: glycosyltransferase [Lachnospiraceae bacterium]|jgi:glycosyltransferase involved in cell wall biosynthesis|nr:glycosyltransferase [Lachnospiraceae bacterium]
MEIKVSVILISYNVSQYIRECMESIVNQTLKEIEILCVDAFSTDGTREVLQEYMQKDSRIRLLDDTKKSCGYSYNLGIRQARGKYVGFLETDDYVRPDMFERLYDLAEKNRLDYAKANHIPFINVDGKYRCYEEERIFAWNETLYNQVISPFYYPEIIGPDHCMWNGIYRADFLRQNRIRLNETQGPSYQDHGFQWQTICSAKRVMYIDEGLYFYRKDNEAASMKKASGLVKDFYEYMFIKEYLLKRGDITREHWWAYFGKMVWSVHTWCSNLLVGGRTLPKEAYEMLSEYIKEFQEGLAKGYISPVKLGFDLYWEVLTLIKSKEIYLLNMYEKVHGILDYQDRIIEWCKQGEKVIIAGAGNCGKRFYSLMKRMGMDNVCAFADNNPVLSGKSLFGKEILSVEKACEEYPDAFVVIANHDHYMDLLRQLRENGIPERNIRYYRITGMEF